MSFLVYEKYKDSGAEWLGVVPEGWSVKRLKNVCGNYSSNVDKKSVEGQSQVSLCNYTDVIIINTMSKDGDQFASICHTIT